MRELKGQSIKIITSEISLEQVLLKACETMRGCVRRFETKWSHAQLEVQSSYEMWHEGSSSESKWNDNKHTKSSNVSEIMLDQGEKSRSSEMEWDQGEPPPLDPFHPSPTPLELVSSSHLALFVPMKSIAVLSGFWIRRLHTIWLRFFEEQHAFLHLYAKIFCNFVCL